MKNMEKKIGVKNQFNLFHCLWNSLSELETPVIVLYKASLDKDLEKILWGYVLYL